MRKPSIEVDNTVKNTKVLITGRHVLQMSFNSLNLKENLKNGNDYHNKEK
jgi:hypothetical protein